MAGKDIRLRILHLLQEPLKRKEQVFYKPKRKPKRKLISEFPWRLLAGPPSNYALPLCWFEAIHAEPFTS